MTEDAFLEAIRESREDDTPRLVYADWLDEQDDPRGEFIRVQCEIARLEASGEDPLRLRELRRHDRGLLDDYKAEWTAPLDRWQAFVRFHRGLVDEASFTAADFVEHAAEIFEAVPTLAHLRLRGSLRHIAYLAEVPELSLVTGLELPMGFPRPQDLRLLLHSPHLLRLRSLSLANCLIGSEGMAVLATSPIRNQLASLNLQCNRITKDDVGRLMMLLDRNHLLSLNLAENYLSADTMQSVASYVWENELQEFTFSRNRIGERGIDALLNSPFMRSLRVLRLSGCDLSQGGLDLMARWSRLEHPRTFRHVEVLDLSDNGIERSLSALGGCGEETGLRDSDLSRNPFNHFELDSLFRAIDPDRLVRLNLSRTGIAEYDMAAVNTLGHDYPMPRLRELDISYCDLNAKNLIRLIESPHFDSLERLILSGNAVTPSVVEALLKSKFLDQLQWLELNPDGWRADSNPWRQLKERLGDRVDLPDPGDSSFETTICSP